MSKRQNRRHARDGAHQLRNKPGWDPQAVKTNPLDALRELTQKEQTDSAYDAAKECEVCLKTREDSGDETALCEKHLGEAMTL